MSDAMTGLKLPVLRCASCLDYEDIAARVFSFGTS
jgi:hypothetical protein